MACKNAPTPILLRLIYAALRVVVWVSVRVFYRKRLVLGREHFRFDGPAIVVANHPSTLMDVLNPALEICQEMFFLANYGLFRHPVSRWLLTRLFCIPVMRPEDVRPGEERDNSRAFEASFQHLERGGVLFIAPEGTSWMNRFVRPLKTGTARIALGAEARNNWQLGVKIVPVGLSYSAPHRFRSEVVVNAGPAVYAAEWRAVWETDPAAAIEGLTQYLEGQLKQLSIHTGDEAGEQALTMWEEILQNDEPLPQRAAFERSQRLAHTLLHDAEAVRQTLAYRQALEQAGLSDAAFSPRQRKRRLQRWIGLLLGSPLFAVGAVFWFLPCFIPYWLNRRLNLYVGYSATVMVVAGIVVFPLYGWAAFRVARWAGLSAGAAVAALTALTALGLFVEWYWEALRIERMFCRAKKKGLPPGVTRWRP
ncbi:MAG: 1-acyl-sn-glycerol-3-phosphate acyltransferase [Saprospiraceae bacterium]|nr:1-acyl-sn-glycerol-3-phosphate acyltransferase [Saprospiraceae bacterium]MDW8229036.1 1-acyl-sn-glycerol-3-phosphate acyltransferase [Saprospiraceae bacterium]